MRRRLAVLATGAALAACAAVTGLGDYSISDDAADGATESATAIDVVQVVTNEAATPDAPDVHAPPLDSGRDSEITKPPPPNGVECDPSLTCDGSAGCCYHVAATYSAPSCMTTQECTQGISPILVPVSLLCDEPVDCKANEDCCVLVYPAANNGKYAPIGSSCKPKGTCMHDGGSSGALASARARESCVDGGPCAVGTCTDFSYDLGSEVPKLHYCSY